MSAAVSQGVLSGQFVPFSRLYWSKAIEQLHLARQRPEQPAAVGAAVATCILLGYAAAEAYVAELPLLEGVFRGVDLDKAQQVADRVEKKGLEKAIASVTSSRTERKLPWKRELRCVRELRNALVHFDVAYRMPDEWPKRLAECNCKQFIQGWATGSHDWTSQLTITPVAYWAVRTIRQSLEKLHQFIGGVSPWSPAVST